MKSTIIKLSLTCVALILTSCASGQIGKGYAPTQNEAAIYGVFVQRLGFSSGGTPQTLFIRNIETKEVVRVTVKPTWASKQKNSFSAKMKPGTYELTHYHFPEGYTQNWKNIYSCSTREECIKINERIKNNDTTDLVRYKFTVESNKINCIGVLDFSQAIPVFRNNEDEIASILKEDNVQHYGSGDRCKTPQ